MQKLYGKEMHWLLEFQLDVGKTKNINLTRPSAWDITVVLMLWKYLFEHIKEDFGTLLSSLSKYTILIKWFFCISVPVISGFDFCSDFFSHFYVRLRYNMRKRFEIVIALWELTINFEVIRNNLWLLIKRASFYR